MNATKRYGQLAAPGYAVAVLLIVIPLLDTLLSALPIRAGTLNWRFGALGLFSRALMTPLLGLLVAFAVSLLLDHKSVQRGLLVLAALGVLLLALALPLFVLDAVQLRASVRAEVTSPFDLAMILALGKYIAALAALVLLGRSCWKASRRQRRA